jgi:DNA-binding Lrp family transcriptional regulator
VDSRTKGNRAGGYLRRPAVWYHFVDGAIGKERTMVTAFVLINCRRDAIQETANALAQVEGITEVYSVAGQFDLVAVLRVKGNEEVADVVTGHLLRLQGIERTQTLISFRAYSKFDLDRMFSVGME